jgi:hypothetical protein
MAFPTTSVLDDFNRADENPMTGWSSFVGAGARHEVVGNTCEASGAAANDYWNAATFGPDCEVYATVVEKTTGALIKLYARLVSVGSVAVDGYAVRHTTVSGAANDTIGLYRVDNATETLLGSAFTQEVAVGDSFGLEIVGDTLTAYYKASGGSWTALGTETDSTHAGAGNIGVAISVTNTAGIDDFGGGTIASSAVTIEPSVGSQPITGRTPTIGWSVGMPDVP